VNERPILGNNRTPPSGGIDPRPPNLCPACRLPITTVGRLVAAVDDAGQPFVFALCHRCSHRLDGLPHQLQNKSLERALIPLARHPERYVIRAFESSVEAHLYCHLAAEAPHGDHQ